MSENILKEFIENKVIILEKEAKFKFASGIMSPIYCDMRSVLSYPDITEKIVDKYIEKIKETKNLENLQVVVGVATAGIPWASMIAQKLHLPLAYVRVASKDHGKKKMIEGANVENKNIIVIEDVISTGGSSMRVLEELEKNQANMKGLYCIYTYLFPQIQSILKEYNDKFYYLYSFDSLIELAKQDSFFTKEDIEKLISWKNSVV